MTIVLQKINRFLLVTCVTLVCSTNLAAQMLDAQHTDTTSIEEAYIPTALDYDLDSLVQAWHNKYTTPLDSFCHDDAKNVETEDEVYQKRLEALPTVIPMTYNSTVQKYINLYVEKRRTWVKHLLGSADYYFPIIEPILEREGLPLELKYLAIVESGLDPFALSRVGASGLWQFMLPTARAYGLTVNSLVDERRDPIKSTIAACQYFKDMYAIFQDWHLVIATYHCGIGNINKAIKRSGGKTDFWQLYNYLPRDTRIYIPLYIAATYALTYHCEHNICAVKTNIPLATDTIQVNKMLHFDQISETLGVDMEILKMLNPQYQREIVPGNTGKDFLRLPAAQCYAIAIQDDTLFNTQADNALAGLTAVNEQNNNKQKSSTQHIVHRAKKGENLHTIANKYGVTALNLRRWNSMSTNNVNVGRRINVYVDNQGIAYAGAEYKAAPVQSTKAPTIKINPGDITYKVKSGDSLYIIAKKYPGVSAKDIQNENLLPTPSIWPGQVLRIPKT